MRDLWLLLWAAGRRSQSVVRYWVTVFGYDPSVRSVSTWMYGFYLILIGAGLVALTAFEVLGSVAVAGAQLAAAGSATRQAWLAAVPGLILAIQVLAIARAWGSGPVRLTWPAIAYIAGSPLSGRAIVAAAYLRALLVALPLSGVVAALAALLLSGRDHAALSALAVGLPVALLTVALAWLAGLVRLAAATLRPLAPMWPLLLALAVLGVVAPGFALWPGRVLAGIFGGCTGSCSAATPAAVAVVLGVAGSAGVILLGRAIDLRDVCDESGVFARLAVLSLADRLNPAILLQVRTQAHAGGRPLRLHLPRASEGWLLVATRSGLAILRRPWALANMLADLVLAVGASFILAGRIPGWFLWVILMAAAPPRLSRHWTVDAEDPFLRQFLPQSGLSLLSAETAAPGLLVSLGAAAIWLLSSPPAATLALGLVTPIVVLALGAACQALATRAFGRVHVPFAAVAAVAFALVMLVGVIGRSPLGALAVALGIIAVLGSIIQAA